MSVSFIRIDDRMIHGQTCTRWAREYPCDGLIAVNDKAAQSDVLKAAYKAASGKKLSSGRWNISRKNAAGFRQRYALFPDCQKSC